MRVDEKYTLEALVPGLLIELRNGGAFEVGDDWTRCFLPSGPVVYGSPQGTEEQAQTAASLGCTPLEMVLLHDPLHMALADWLGFESHSLRAAAGLDMDRRIADLEEAAVMAVQRLIVALKRPGSYAKADWEDLRGCAPDATGNLSSEAFMRELRDDWRGK